MFFQQIDARMHTQRNINGRTTGLLGLVGLLLLALMPLKGFSQASMNMVLMSNWDNNSLAALPDGTTYNDLWGYSDGLREYAILGTIEGFYIIEVTDPTNPLPILFRAGSSNNSLWRDFKTYQNYLYCVSDQGASSSLQVYDLTNLNSGNISKVYDSQTDFSTAHNIFVNEATGRLYVAGANTAPSGLIIMDIGTNPESPALLANYSLGAYVHDVYVHRDTCVAFFGYSGLGLFDFANIATPSAIDMLITTYPDQGYAHSGYADENFEHLYWATETNGTGMKISDFTQGFVLDPVGFFRSNLLGGSATGSVPHNPFVKGNMLYTSYYHDGVQIWDISNPKNPVLAAFYDTYPSNTNYTGFQGCWGVYPYLPSGMVMASDKENGLFLFSVNSTFPVELKDFRADPIDDRIRLSWTTTQELNNDFFKLERSVDGENFIEVARLQGQGNSQEEVDYEWNDDAKLDGRIFYRLTQHDLDGQANFTEVVTVDLKPESRLVSIGPNPAPAGENIHIEVSLPQEDQVQTQVFDLSGSMIFQSSDAMDSGLNHKEISTRNWASGTYFVKIITSGQVHAGKLLLR